MKIIVNRRRKRRAEHRHRGGENEPGAPTLAGLAQRIELVQLGDPNSPEYAALLREIEALSDEEARQMLAEGEAEV